MSSSANLTGLGLPAEQALSLGWTLAAVSAAGTTVADATAVKKQQTFIILTATGSDGISLPSDADLMRPYVVANTSGSTGKVYAQSGGKINGGSTDAAESLTTTVTAVFWRTSTTEWVGVLGA